jgi:deoxyribonuclease IV
MTKRIGVHLGTAGGPSNAVLRAREIGANTLQIFSSSPRMWRAAVIDPEQATRMRELRAAHDIGPLVIHASYLLNVCSQTETVRENSIRGFRGEVERALTLGADYLVLHPGSWKGLSRSEGLRLAAESIERAIDGIPWQSTSFTILIENTAGSECSLGGSFDQVAELVMLLRTHAPVAVCLDTCHTHVAGYDLISEEGYESTMIQIEATMGFDAVRVWHCNDSRAARGSKLDRHQHIGKGTIGKEAVRRLLNDARFGHRAFIAETPVDEDGNERSNLRALRSLVRWAAKNSLGSATGRA